MQPVDPLLSLETSFVDEILTRHGRSTQPESRQLVAILGAVCEVIKQEGLSPSPAAVYGATMNALESPGTRSSAEILQACLTLLSLALSRMPDTAVRLKHAAALNIVAPIVEASHNVAGPLKAALGCLAHILRACDPQSDFAESAPSFALLLKYALDERPKVRKRAAAGVVEVLVALQRSPACSKAAEVVVAASQEILSGPEAAARAAADASKKHKQDLEATIERAVADALHLLGLLKQATPMLPEPAAIAIGQMLLRLFPLGQPLLNRHAADCLCAVAAAPSCPLGAKSLHDLVAYILDQRDFWDRRDVEGVISMTRVVQLGAIQLHATHAGVAAALLPKVFHGLVPQLAAEQDGVRHATSEALREIAAACIDEAMITAAITAASGAPSPLQSVIAALGSALGPRFQESWGLALPVVGSVIERLGRPGAPLARPLIEKIGEFLAGAFDATEADQQSYVACANAAEAALGCALKALGPSQVLSVLPFNFEKGMDGQGEARTWMLPLLRDHVRESELEGWGTALMPVARSMIQRAQAYQKAGNAQRAQQCRALEQQVWATLPSFASWCTDLGAGMKKFGRELGLAFQNREDLRVAILLTLERMCLQTREAARRLGLAEQHRLTAAHPLASSRADGDEGDEDADEPAFAEDGAAAVYLEGEHGQVPAWFTPAHVTANLAVLRSLAPSFLPLLFNAFVAARPEGRGHLARAIAAYCLVAERTTVANAFKTVGDKLARVTLEAKSDVPLPNPVLEGGDSPQQRRATFLELALCLAGGLDDAGAGALFKAAGPCLTEPDSAIQKKGYKLMAYLLEARQTFVAAHLTEVLQLLVGEGAKVCVSAARRFRLRCVSALVYLLSSLETLPSGVVLPEDTAAAAGMGEDADADAEATPETALHAVVSKLVAEIVLCVKEANKRTRTSAYELLVELGHRFVQMEEEGEMEEEAAAGGSGQSLGAGGLEALFHMVLAGLAGTHPHMLSATVMALARMLYAFAGNLQPVLPELLPAVLLLLRTKSREVVKSVLGFVKVVAMRLPVEDLTPYVKPILEGVLLWAEDSKNRFKLKVRLIVERLAKRCGFDAVAAGIPASDSKLLTHIRKEHSRKERRRHSAEEDGGDEEDADIEAWESKSMAKTARASEWGHSKIFSEGGQTARTVGGRPPSGPKSGGVRLVDGMGADQSDPMDLLDTRTSRRLVKASARRTEGAGSDDDDAPPHYERAADGRLVILDDAKAAKRKAMGLGAGRGGEDSDDDMEDDFDDEFEQWNGKGKRRTSGSDAKSVGGRSMGGRSMGGRSETQRTAGGRSMGATTARTGATARTSKTAKSSRYDQHSGDRFKAKKGQGDTKGASKVDPYAYWPLDRRLLNRRADKKRGASQGLAKVVKAQGGVKKGMKAKVEARQQIKKAMRK